MKKPLGCFSVPGLLLSLLLFGAVVGYTLIEGGVLFSPGPLAALSPRGTLLGGYRSHAEFENQCALCHRPFSGVDTPRCTACHTDVRDQVANRSGLHGQWQQADRCLHCHTEHQGQTANITTASTAGFLHEQVGFSLAAHQRRADGQPFTCADCHNPPDYSFDPATCERCHAQKDAVFMAQHVAAFGRDCLSCHTGSGPAINFAHNAIFPLDGAHAGLACSACHANGQYQGTPADCAGCHTAPANHYSGQCEQCHNTTSWSATQFDHTGLTDCQSCHAQDAPANHYSGQCSQCHNTASWSATRFDHTGLTDCQSCHTKDAPANHYSGQCSLCHTSTTAWNAVQFSHSFPIDHGGANGNCVVCHPGNDYTRYDCSRCHDDEGGGDD